MISITDLIHHRPPVLCIDEIVECNETDATCAMTVREGAFTDGECLWEPMLLEAVAQTAAVMSGNRLRKIGTKLERGLLVGVRGFAIHREVRVGERVVCHVKVLRRLDQFVLVDGRVTCGDDVVAEGQLKFHEVVGS